MAVLSGTRWAAAATLFYVVLMVAISMLLPPRPIALTIWTAFILMIYLLPPLRMRAAVANGALADSSATDGRVQLRFAETRPISTYLFAFAAGRFHFRFG